MFQLYSHDLEKGNQAFRQWIYTSHQILNKYVNSVYCMVVQFSLYASALILIFCTYVLVKFSNGSYIMVRYIVLCVIVTAAYALKSTLTSTVSCRVNSSDCCQLGRNTLATFGSRMIESQKSPFPVALKKY